MTKPFLFTMSFVMLLAVSCKKTTESKQQQQSSSDTNDATDLQNDDVSSEQYYEYGEKIFKLNNLDTDELSKNHLTLIHAIGIKPDSIIERGADHFDEFGYRFYICYFNDDRIEISGGADLNGDQYYIHGIDIVGNTLDLNNIKVGDPIDKVKKEFSKCVIKKDAIVILRDGSPLTFYHKNGIITRIELITLT